MLGSREAVTLSPGAYQDPMVGAFMVDTELEHRLRNLSKLLKAARQNYDALNNILTMLKTDADSPSSK